jgi:DNA (cytosine-5)-methyltransferase 1
MHLQPHSPSSLKAIDLFAGGGGFSTGAAMAGVDVVWAANHWPLAVDYHARNHPLAKHACQDLRTADWRTVPQHDIMLASPCCQGHSPARGKDRPHHDIQRTTAFAVVEAAEYHRPEAVLVENVVEMRTWDLFPAWLLGMEKLGYTMAAHTIDAADHGVPQNRERLFMLFTRSKAPLHLKLPKRDHVPFRRVIDWNSTKWNPIVRPKRSPATLRRIAAGRAQFGDTFVAPYYGSGSGETGRSLDRPIGTITTVDRWAIIRGDEMRMVQKDEARIAMGFPENYILPRQHKESMKLLGNAVCPPVVKDILIAFKEQA